MTGVQTCALPIYDFSKGDQEPWIEGVIREEFVVNQGNAVKPLAEKPIVQIAVNAEPPPPQKISISDNNNLPTDYDKYLTKYYNITN